MLSQAHAHAQPRVPWQMHFSLLQKPNCRSSGLIFFIQKQRSNRKYVALVYLWRTLAIRLSKSISKFCTSTFKPLRKVVCPVLPKAPLFRCWAGSVRSQESGTAPASLAQPHSRATSWRGDMVNSDTVDVSSLELFSYFLLHY